MEKVGIFDIVKPYDNDIISSMDNEYQKEYLNYLNKYILGLREILYLSKKITFGIEIEVENIKKYIYSLEENQLFDGWIFTDDNTLFCGREVDSPILKDENNFWNTLYILLNNLSKCSEIDLHCGGHIHIGAQILGNDVDYYTNLFKLWCAYENVIFRFGYGEFISERLNIKEFATPLYYIGNELNFDLKKNFFQSMYCMALNYAPSYERRNLSDGKAIKGCTIEVRSPNGSLNPIIWQNNVNFFVKLFEYAKSDLFDENKILKKIETLKNNLESYGNILDYYRQIDINGAIELADLIFDNNLDKVYFLRQYIKNYEVGSYELEMGKKFTKNPNY